MKISIQNISKTFGKTIANKNLSLEITSGKIHALLGENGAGKSTLVKILSGHQKPDSGSILIDDDSLKLGSTSSSLSHGVGILSQDPLDFNNLSILESFSVGSKKFGALLNKKKLSKEINDILLKYEINISIDKKIRSLSIGERQQIELVRLLFEDSKIIILDEPTNGFSLKQRELVFNVLKKLSNSGCIIILVSHKLDEVFDLCQEATILKNGSKIKTIPIPYDRNKIMDLMFQSESFQPMDIKSNNHLSNNFIEIDLSRWGFKNVKIPECSSIGVIGLQGSGGDKFIREIFTSKIGCTYKIGEKIPDKKKFYTPSDRLEKGLFDEFTIDQHVALTYENTNLISWKKTKHRSGALISDYEIKGTRNSFAKQLSGGNQQKLQLALIPKIPGLILLEQPTRGLDVKSTQSVWKKITERSKSDISVIFSTTDIDEVWNHSDWIICFSGEKITKISKREEINKGDLKFYISGISV